jgi:hypothetical protein
VPTTILERPVVEQDHAPYYSRYVELVPAGDLVTILQGQLTALRDLLAPVKETKAGYAYEEGKWTIREVIGHITDTERVFAYRATAFSRGDRSPLPGFDQAEWTPRGEYDRRPLADVLAEWAATREATIALVRAMPAAGLARHGMASGATLSALAAIVIIAGHIEYHLRHLSEMYLPGVQ